MDGRVTEPSEDMARSGVRPVLILVHGTGDTSALDGAEPASPTDPSADIAVAAPRWWQAGSRFDSWLSDRLGDPQGEPLDETSLVRFVWSGLNSEKAREQAAFELAEMARSLAREGRSLHFLAHSHGGNVVRRAIELGARGRYPFAARIKSVTTFGTPFFHYSASARLWALVMALLGVGLAGGATAMVFSMLQRITDENWQVPALILLGLLGGATCYLIGAALVTLFRLSPGRRNRRPPLAEGIDFCNFFAGKDEAIGLLTSFNQQIVLMQRADFIQVWMRGPVGCGFVLTLIAALVGGVAAAWEGMGGTFEYMFASVWGFVVTTVSVVFCVAVGLLVAFILNGILMLGLTLPVRLGAAVMDGMITQRLRALAYGSDAGNGMASVELHPWTDAEQVAQPLPADIESAIERHVAENTGDLWAKIRAGLVSGVPFLSQDLQSVIQRALTWDELSHTVYYHVEGFADLVASRLIGTGEWRARSAPADGQAER